jgi:hypothetical protein
MSINLLFFLSLARLAAAEHELALLQASAPGGSSVTSARIEAPVKLGNLQEAMQLSDDYDTYRCFCVSFPFCEVL